MKKFSTLLLSVCMLLIACLTLGSCKNNNSAKTTDEILAETLKYVTTRNGYSEDELYGKSFAQAYYEIEYIDITEESESSPFQSFNDYIYISITRHYNYFSYGAGMSPYPDWGNPFIFEENSRTYFIDTTIKGQDEQKIYYDTSNRENFEKTFGVTDDSDLWKVRYVGYENFVLPAQLIPPKMTVMSYNKKTGELKEYAKEDAPYQYEWMYFRTLVVNNPNHVFDHNYGLKYVAYGDAQDCTKENILEKIDRTYGSISLDEIKSILLKINEDTEIIEINPNTGASDDTLTQMGNGCIVGKNNLKGIKITHESNFRFYSSAIISCPNLEWILFDCTNVEDNKYVQIFPRMFSNCNSLQKIFYKGTQSDYEKYVRVYPDNDVYNQATVYFYSENEPTTDGNYWHYDTDGKTPVLW